MFQIDLCYWKVPGMRLEAAEICGCDVVRGGGNEQQGDSVDASQLYCHG